MPADQEARSAACCQKCGSTIDSFGFCRCEEGPSTAKLGGAEGAHPTSGNENPDAPKNSAATRLIRTFDLVAALLWPPYPWRGFRVWFWRNYYLVRDWREWYA